MIVTGGVAVAATCSTARLPLPYSSCTPGTYNPDVTQSNIHSTICVSGWTATVRPPTSYTNPLKVQGIADYEEDHMVPLELGGAPRDPKNLWPEPYSGTQAAHTKDGTETKSSGPGGVNSSDVAGQVVADASATFTGSSSDKDRLETKLKVLVCSGQVLLATAQQAITTDWVAAYHKYVGS
ncbi:hypothetical protein [Amycolatopsis sp. DSM 110486]|uniref:hypothetical protein n=1 Tax=Amycolatopsis sp. DSM 110486 TaxID=2865832 RepID=UPI002103B6F7|nr:hypothetical protein [Amycolatopsis sp. DSM 110486]